jgi:hypothetical protein
VFGRRCRVLASSSRLGPVHLFLAMPVPSSFFRERQLGLALFVTSRDRVIGRPLIRAILSSSDLSSKGVLSFPGRHGRYRRTVRSPEVSRSPIVTIAPLRASGYNPVNLRA